MVRSVQDGGPKSKASAPAITGMRQGGEEARPHLPSEALAQQRDPEALPVPGDRQHQLAPAAVTGEDRGAWVMWPAYWRKLGPE